MRATIRNLAYSLATIALVTAYGCATSSPPPPALSYVAVERPSGQIMGGGERVETKHSRGGPYFLNVNFRPAPDMAAYLKQAQSDAGSNVLKNADVQLEVPFAFDILLFGFQGGSDTVKANQ